MNMQTRETKATGDQVLLLFIISSTSQTPRQLKKIKSLVRKAKAVVCVCERTRVRIRACAVCSCFCNWKFKGPKQYIYCILYGTFRLVVWTFTGHLRVLYSNNYLFTFNHNFHLSIWARLECWLGFCSVLVAVVFYWRKATVCLLMGIQINLDLSLCSISDWDVHQHVLTVSGQNNNTILCKRNG